MNTNLNHGSATIYQFPPGGRSALGGRRYQDAKSATKSAIDSAAARMADIASGSGWYHEAAILEAKPVRER